MKSFRYIITVIVIMATCSLHAATLDDQYAVIRYNLESGKIDTEDYYLYLAQSVLDPAALPSDIAIEITEPIKSGTSILKEIRLNWDSFSSDLKARMQPLITRPTTECKYLSPDGYFWVHYDTASGMETPVIPLDDIDSSGVPDFVENIASYADSARRHIVETLGYSPPPSDGTLGGDELYDLYFQQGMYYGITWGDTPYTFQCSDGYTSHIRLHRNFLIFEENDDPEGDQKGSMKVAIAHEFFHAVQFYYDAFVATWWGEAVSVWMEEQVFPLVNDNYNYFDHFWPYPQKSLLDSDDLEHAYGSFVWPMFLEENFGRDFIRTVIMNTCFGSSPITTTQLEFQTLETSLNTEFGKFLYWNYVTDGRADGECYEDAADYPDVAITRTHTSIPALNQAGSNPPYTLGSNYIRFDNDSLYEGILQFEIDTVQAGQWGLLVITADTTLTQFDYELYNYINGSDTRYYVPYIDRYDHVAFVPHIRGSSANGPYAYNYSISYRLVGDVDYSGAIDIDDVVFILAYLFQGGPAPEPPEAAEVECNGDVSIDDVVYLIAYLYNGGPPPCGLGFE